MRVNFIFKQVLKGMGFVPNSLIKMSEKPNILGTFSLFFANVKGFSNPHSSPITGVLLSFYNLLWMLQAKINRKGEVPLYLKNLVSYASSNAAGCRYCQAHTAYEAHENGVSVEKLNAVWDFQNSPLFTEKEKAAIAFGLASGMVPNQVTQEMLENLKLHFTDPQIIELVSTVSIFGFLNRWNDSMATELEPIPLAFAEKHLSKNWEAGKHKKPV